MPDIELSQLKFLTGSYQTVITVIEKSGTE